jgi:protein associated with RNAse G/E
LKQLESLLKSLQYNNLKYCGTQVFFDGTKHVYYEGRMVDTTYEIDIRVVSHEQVEIWDKTEFEQQRSFLGRAKKNNRGWSLTS